MALSVARKGLRGQKTKAGAYFTKRRPIWTSEMSSEQWLEGKEHHAYLYWCPPIQEDSFRILHNHLCLKLTKKIHDKHTDPKWNQIQVRNMAQEPLHTGNEMHEVDVPLLETNDVCATLWDQVRAQPNPVTCDTTEFLSTGIRINRLGNKWTITKGLQTFIILIQLLLTIARHNVSRFFYYFLLL